ncbi:class I SAM-dependent methyltransferase [uncultured Pseudokineococcus sp.]|uniref:class I SAM-dependent methyltransferase n=1 Tax=uncultured Pseudokineococcus sp. TaxID=1642928 RepID=UPI0026136A21|nr:methyltransferase domain-containing protein [uncultured Pseudokineococcus sp.]
MPAVARYAHLGRLYDLVSGERLYAPGREAAVEMIHVEPGSRVLVVGIGTGPDLPALLSAAGPGGRVVGLDASPSMLAAARRRADRLGGDGVRLVLADAEQVPARRLRDALGGPADAVLLPYCLSLMPAWPRAWRTALEAARPGARVAVVDTTVARGALLRRLASRVACAAGGVHVDARPWRCVEELDDVSAATFLRGHVEVRGGTLPLR